MKYSPPAVDYATHFEYKVLQKIHGEPTYKDIENIKNKLQGTHQKKHK